MCLMSLSTRDKNDQFFWDKSANKIYIFFLDSTENEYYQLIEPEVQVKMCISFHFEKKYFPIEIILIQHKIGRDEFACRGKNVVSCGVINSKH